MKNRWKLALIAGIAAVCSLGAFAAPKKQATEQKEKGPSPDFPAFLRWNDPSAEEKWQSLCSKSTRISTEPRMAGVDAGHAKGLLESFSLRYMPNTHAHYQKTRLAALELVQTLHDNFPDGQASDPTGGRLHGKLLPQVQAAVAELDRRHDELCFFLLFHQAGVFSDAVLAAYDERTVPVWLAGETASWPDDMRGGVGELPPEDITFADKFMPEALAGWRRMSALFDEGAKQYRGLRQTARELDAPRARLELEVFRQRLSEIRIELDKLKNAFPVWRMRHALGDALPEELEKLDHETAVAIQKAEKAWNVKAYVLKHCRVP